VNNKKWLIFTTEKSVQKFRLTSLEDLGLLLFLISLSALAQKSEVYAIIGFLEDDPQKNPCNMGMPYCKNDRRLDFFKDNIENAKTLFNFFCDHTLQNQQQYCYCYINDGHSSRNTGQYVAIKYIDASLINIVNESEEETIIKSCHSNK